MTKRDADYFSQKYSLTRTHSEVLHAATIVPPGRALDLGCGNGRNSLYLAANGFAVTAWDKNPMSVNNLESIRAAERLDNLQTAVKDLNSLSFDGEYDLILSTVVMMFLEPDTIPGLIANMQRCTAAGGYNLIVAAMDTEDYPCTVGFPFAFKPDELPTAIASNCASPPCWRASLPDSPRRGKLSMARAAFPARAWARQRPVAAKMSLENRAIPLLSDYLLT